MTRLSAIPYCAYVAMLSPPFPLIPIAYARHLMAVPKRKQSNSRTGKRRSHHAKRPRQTAACPKCSRAVPLHVICPNCGHYMGRAVVEMEQS